MATTNKRRGSGSSVTGRAARSIGLLVGLLLLMNAAMSAINSESVHIKAWHKYTVVAGDTLWVIATKADPGDRTDAVYTEIERVNGLVSAVIYPGQVIEVPSN